MATSRYTSIRHALGLGLWIWFWLRRFRLGLGLVYGGNKNATWLIWAIILLLGYYEGHKALEFRVRLEPLMNLTSTISTAKAAVSPTSGIILSPIYVNLFWSNQSTELWHLTLYSFPSWLHEAMVNVERASIYPYCTTMQCGSNSFARATAKDRPIPLYR